ncbi:LPD1 domain-containing protein [Pseudobacillus badius]|uniref:LPD1 domain-containing protein n=1 Tax=Bacillus badius TaxID=1455 RepID=UPI003D34D2BB
MTALTKERILSLRKKMIEKEFEQKGIALGVHEFKLKLKDPVSSYLSYTQKNHWNTWFYGSKMMDELVESLTKQIRKKIESMKDWDETKIFIESLFFGQYELISIQPLFQLIEEGRQKAAAYRHYRIDMSEHERQMVSKEERCLKNDYDEGMNEIKKAERNIELLARVVNLKYATAEQRTQLMKENIPLQLTIRKRQPGGKGKEVEESIYGIISGPKVSKKRHNRELYFPKYGASSMVKVVDLPIILAEAFIINTLEAFLLNNRDHYRFALMQTLFMKCFDPETKHLHLPYINEKFQADLHKAFEDAGLMDQVAAIWPQGGSAKDMMEAFYLSTNEKGHIEHIRNNLVLFTAIPELLRQAGQVVLKTEHLLQQRSDYAKSFETKKHINKKTQQVMENNVYLDIFGYVELDNDVDLNLFKKLEEEFVAFQKIIPLIKMKDHSFRIKKLGHHRAAGLYFPYHRATIVDIDSPSSFAHEWAHSIDFTFLGSGYMLSEGLAFRRVLHVYEEVLQRKVDQLPIDDPFKQQWEGKSKYNSSYYLMPTEVFARSFELYLYQKRVETSFLKPKYEDIVYPEDQRYLQVVICYFDDLMSQLQKRKDQEEVTLISKVEKNGEIQQPVGLVTVASLPEKTSENYNAEKNIVQPVMLESNAERDCVQLSLF